MAICSTLHGGTHKSSCSARSVVGSAVGPGFRHPQEGSADHPKLYCSFARLVFGRKYFQIELTIRIADFSRLQEHAQPILTGISTLLQTLSNEATKPLLYTVDMVVQSTPASVWAPAMLHSGLFLHLVRTVAQEVGRFTGLESNCAVLVKVDSS